MGKGLMGSCFSIYDNIVKNQLIRPKLELFLKESNTSFYIFDKCQNRYKVFDCDP